MSLFVLRLSVLCKCWTTCALANAVCMLAWSYSDRHVLGLRFCAGWLNCAVLCLRTAIQKMLDNMLVHGTKKKAHKSQKKKGNIWFL